jgi:hypothetical protein
MRMTHLYFPLKESSRVTKKTENFVTSRCPKISGIHEQLGVSFSHSGPEIEWS